MIRKKLVAAHRSYVWRQPGWPAFRVDETALAGPLSLARQEQGKVLGLFRAVGLPGEAAVVRDIWIDEAVATAAIEGEKLDLEAVRSSVMRRLGIDVAAEARVSRNVDGLLDAMQDATVAYRKPLDDDRLLRWQSALFPGGTSGIRRIAVGKYREHAEAMQIVSGPIGHEKVHYEAPPSAKVAREMRRFLKWWEDTRPGQSRREPMDGIARAGIAHLWFETIHPFEDGNGRVGRALVDMALAQDVDSPHRFYSISRQLMKQRKAYYESLADAQRGSLDATPWVSFFVNQFHLACVTSQQVIAEALEKGRFWETHAEHDINERQRKVVKRLLDAGKGGFEGGMSAEKYGSLTGTSKATATRDLAQLQKAGMLATVGQGRATRYRINITGWSTRETK